jgi:1-acyl-sn-glycerol-3-phosphate acyltransferase
VRKAAARAFLAATGWAPEGERPVPRRYVLIAAPHTSNWDLAYLLALSELFEVRVSWLGKAALFRPPLGWPMRAVGGIPVNRSTRADLVAQVARTFARSSDLALVVPAEGTRGRTEYWKSGFYHMARSARVPIVCGYLDYARKRGGFGAAFEPSGDVARDMDLIRAFYADKVGKYPECFGPVRLADESATAADRRCHSSAASQRAGPE